MQCSSKPYKGDKPYLFFSCSGADGALVYPIIDRLCLHGYRVWFDDGSNPGEAGLDVIADALRKSSLAISAMTPASVSSHNFRNELIFRVAKQLPTIVLFPQPMELSPVMAEAVKSFPKVSVADYPDEEKFYLTLFSQPGMSGCLDERPVSREQYQLWKQNSQLYAQQDSDWEEEPTMGSILITRWQNQTPVAADPEPAPAPAPAPAPVEEPKPAPAPAPAPAPVPAPAPAPAEEPKPAPAPAPAPAAEPKPVPAPAPIPAPVPAPAPAPVPQGDSLEPIRRDFAQRRAQLEAEQSAAESQRQTRIASLREQESALKAQLEAIGADIAGEEENGRAAKAQFDEALAALERERAEAEAAEQARLQEAARKAAAAAAVPAPAPTPKADEIVDDWGEATVSAVSAPEDDFEATVSVAAAAPKTYSVTRVATGAVFTMSGPSAIIGRRSKLNPSPDVDLSDDPAVSRRHAEILQMGGRFWIRDNESAGGTEVDGVRLSPGGTAVLQNGSRILLSGKEELLFSTGAAPKPQIVEKLRCINTGEEKILGADPVYLDRSHRAEWQGQVLADPQISGKSHAALLSRGGKRYLLDERSTNGTFLNGELLPHGQERELKDRDLIKLGNASFEYLRKQ